jgi:hypothetical protein
VLGKFTMKYLRVKEYSTTSQNGSKRCVSVCVYVCVCKSMCMCLVHMGIHNCVFMTVHTVHMERAETERQRKLYNKYIKILSREF